MSKSKTEPKSEAAADQHEEVVVRLARRGTQHRIEVRLLANGGERKFVPRTSAGKPMSKLRATGHVGDAHQLLTLWVSGRLDLTAWQEVT